MLRLCTARDDKNSVQNYKVANVNVSFVYNRFIIKTEFTCTHTRTEYQIMQRTAQIHEKAVGKGVGK